MTDPAPPPGWYQHPCGEDGQRWWDGEHWTESIRPMAFATAFGGQPTPQVAKKESFTERIARKSREVQEQNVRRQAAVAALKDSKDRKQGQKDRNEMRKPIGSTVKAPISSVGDKSSGVLACPKCGGAQFKAKRRGVVKGAAWVAAPLSLGLSAVVVAAAPKSRVRCETCKTEYLRG